MQDAVTVALPPFLSLDSVELEPISTGPESAKVNIKAIVAPKEDLCQVDREVDGTPRITLLRVVQAAGTKISLYGSVEGHRSMDLWTLESPNIQTGLEQLGKPRGAFHAQSFVAGSSEAIAALKQQAANAEIQRQEREATLRQRAAEEKAESERREAEAKAREDRAERQRIEMEKKRAALAEENRKAAEKKKEEDEAERQKILLATAEGVHYSGTAKQEDGSFMRIALVFGVQDEKESLVRARILNPDKRKWWRNLNGELRHEDGKGWSIVFMTADAEEEKEIRNKIVGINCDRLEGIYVSPWENNCLSLYLTDDGMEGKFQIPGGILGVPHPVSVHLIKGEGPAPVPNKDSAVPPKTHPKGKSSTSRDPRL